MFIAFHLMIYFHILDFEYESKGQLFTNNQQ